MSKLKKEELLEWLKEEVSRYAFLQTTHPYLAQKTTKKDEQAYQQIREIIREDNIKRDMIVENRLGIKKPEITEEWIEEKETELFRVIIKADYVEGIFIRHFGLPTKKGTQLRKDFIRKIVEKIHARK